MLQVEADVGSGDIEAAKIFYEEMKTIAGDQMLGSPVVDDTVVSFAVRLSLPNEPYCSGRCIDCTSSGPWSSVRN